ncbi:MAG: peptidoglycan recognition protein [Myxococcota bacterium]
MQRLSMRRFSSRSGLALAVVLVGGCVGEALDTPETSHDHGDVQVSPLDIAAWETEGDWVLAPPNMTHTGVSRVGVYLALIEAGAFPSMQARQVGPDGTGEWVDLRPTWSEEDHHVAIANFDGISAGAELRIEAAAITGVQHFRWNAVIPEPELSGPVEEIGATTGALRSELGDLGIVTRSAWGARSTRCTSRNTSKSRIAIHHTVTGSSNPARQMRGIQNFHMDSRGWCDVGYHFLLGADGKIYEGRPLELLGSHVGGNNTGNVGIAFIGCFNSSGCSGLGSTTPPNSMFEAAGKLSRRLSQIYDINITSSTLKGHRDHSGASTSCPGSNVHSRLDDIRELARSSAPPPPPPPPPAEGGSCGHSFGGTYAAGACSSGFQCCNGAWRTRGRCGSCVCVEPTGEVGCSPEPPPPPPPPPTGGSCAHSFGGTYASNACSGGFQCCDGRWRTKGQCGACVCTETTGEVGCSPEPPPPPPPPPAGASCAHSFGGTYASSACSAGFQCCDGRWGSKGQCGACICTEATGEIGCTGGPPPGASCNHTFGGRYANTACSAGFQCCDGRWGTKGQCGSCFCTEATGEAGCGT